MNKHIYKKIMIVACIALGAYACSDMDEYKELYLKDGFPSYTGKLDSVKVYSGHERVMIEGLLMSDPKVSGCMIYWNNKHDSLDIPVTRTENVDTLRQIIDNLPENLYNFEIYTYDQYGNRSVPVYATGDSYGDIFISQLMNRPLKGGDPVSAKGELKFALLPVDMTQGPLYTVVSYTNTNNEKDTIHVAMDQEQVTIDSYKPGTSFTYWTEYVPDTLCIDTFISAKTEVEEIINMVPLKYVGCSDEEKELEDGGKQGWGYMTVDGNPDTYWHSDHSPHVPFPHWLSYDMGEVHTIYCFDLIGRKGAGSQFKDFEMYGKMNEEDEWKLIQTFVHSHYTNGETERLYFDEPVAMRYVKINMLNSHENQPYTFLAEFMMYEK